AAMGSARVNHSAALLPSGKVLVTSYGYDSYDPISNAWTPFNPLDPLTRYGQNVTVLLPTGRLLDAGGAANPGLTATAVIVDDQAGSFAATTALPGPRWGHTLSLL